MHSSSHQVPRYSNRSHTRDHGFTLVEMIVALMIFSAVSTVALGAVIKIIGANKKAQTLQTAVTNMNFALDAISRDFRVGSGFTFGTVPSNTHPLSFSTCGGGTVCFGSDVNNTTDVGIQFVSPQTNAGCALSYAYKFTTQDPSYPGQLLLEKAQQQACGDDLGSTRAPFSPIVSPDVTLTGFQLSKAPTVTGGSYPLIFLKIAGYAGTSDKDKTYFDIQTALSPRTP